jgi:hypothetical protein
VWCARSMPTLATAESTPMCRFSLGVQFKPTCWKASPELVSKARSRGRTSSAEAGLSLRDLLGLGPQLFVAFRCLAARRVGGQGLPAQRHLLDY